MPSAALFADLERQTSGPLEDQRALQLALELSMLGLRGSGGGGGGGGSETTNLPASSPTGTGMTGSPILGDGNHNGGFSSPSQTTELDASQRNTQKKSQNTTECVPVPGSEHVAEIVGRQGCKIKALRAKTNTYIKTPVRGEEPVFVVTGRREDVNAAKREILSAAEHFSSIRAQRKNNGLTGSMAPGPNSTMPGQTTVHVRVPYRVVGLVVGPKGATIKRIQQQTNTYIVTPSREREPVFEVTGLPENVDTARKEIEAHIAMRTGGSLSEHGSIGSGLDDQDLSSSAFLPPHSMAGLAALDAAATLSAASLHHDSVFGSSAALFGSSMSGSGAPGGGLCLSSSQMVNGGLVPRGTVESSLSSAFPFPSKLYPSLSLYESDDALTDSPPFDALGPVWPTDHFGGSQGRLTTSSSSSSGGSRSSSQDGSLELFKYGSGGSGVGHVGAVALNVGGAGLLGMSGVASTDRVSPTDSLGSAGRGSGGGLVSSNGGLVASAVGGGNGASRLLSSARECVVCFESEIVAALVPCGHGLFCLECANRIVGKPNAECPVCHQPCRQAMRIYN